MPTEDGRACFHESQKLSVRDSMQRKRVLVIGLDGATFDLLIPLFGLDWMPFFSSLLAKSYYSDLLSTVPPISAAAWTTFITGVNPGQHGILQFVALRPNQATSDDDSQEIFPGGFSLLNASSIRCQTLWELLSQAGKYQVVINVPMTYPPRPINGIMVTGMMTPTGASIYTYPPQLSQSLSQAHYEIDLSIAEKEFDFDPARLIDRLRQLLMKRRSVALQLMRREPWDFFMLVFTGTDRLQHRFFRCIVPGFPQYDSTEAIRLRPQLERYFRDLDHALAQLVAAAGSDTTVIILSDHGFGPVSERTVHRISMMKKLGLTKYGAKSCVVRLRYAVEGYLGLTPDRVRKLAKSVLPGKWASKMESGVRQSQLAAGAYAPAYSVTLHEHVGGIYINRHRGAGDHSATSMSDDAYEAFRQEIVSSLKKLVDPETEVSLIPNVYTREELYSGMALEDCPDIVFYVAPGYGLSGGVGPAGAMVSPRRGEPHKQGTHRDEGILLICGPSVEAQHAAEHRLIDVTSTILYLLDVPIPPAMDSRPILEAFERQAVAQRPPRYADSTLVSRFSSEPELGEEGMSEEDAQEVLKRLRGLGYIE